MLSDTTQRTRRREIITSVLSRTDPLTRNPAKIQAMMTLFWKRREGMSSKHRYQDH
jgi:hypothetical protein